MKISFVYILFRCIWYIICQELLPPQDLFPVFFSFAQMQIAIVKILHWRGQKSIHLIFHISFTNVFFGNQKPPLQKAKHHKKWAKYPDFEVKNQKNHPKYRPKMPKYLFLDSMRSYMSATSDRCCGSCIKNKKNFTKQLQNIL